MNASSKRKIISQSEISKKIAVMNEEMQGFWANNSWDIRKCPHPSAIELSKNPALRNRWVRFERVKNLWLRTELKYFYFYHHHFTTFHAPKGIKIQTTPNFLYD